MGKTKYTIVNEHKVNNKTVGYVLKDLVSNDTKLYNREQTILLAERSEIGNCLCQLKSNNVDIKIVELKDKAIGENTIDLGGMRYINSLNKDTLLCGDTKAGFYRFCIDILTLLNYFNTLYDKDIALYDILVELKDSNTYYIHIVTKSNKLMCCVSLETSTLSGYCLDCNILIPGERYIETNKMTNFNDTDERKELIHSIVKEIYSLHSTI